MPTTEILVSRPQRWDVPFDPDMTDQDVQRLLEVEPFCRMCAEDFPASVSLEGILRNDTRIINASDGDLLVREGDYGNSAFLVLNGQVRVALESLAPDLLGRQQPQKSGWLKSLGELFKNPQRAEVRKLANLDQSLANQGLGTRKESRQTRVFLQDVPRILTTTNTVGLGRGEILGELAALSRTPRTATVFAEGDARLLEIRWQGLRDLMRSTSELRHHVERLYRENSLRVHLRETPLLRDLPVDSIEQVARRTQFASYGNFDWHTEFGSYGERDPLEQLAGEPVIAAEGTQAENLILIRSGFARLSHSFGNSHRTVAYLGKGGMYGMAELASINKKQREQPLQFSLRAVGYVDVLLVPRDVVEQSILPHLPPDNLPNLAEFPQRADPAEGSAAQPIEARTLDFLMDHRLVNGTQTMLIDLNLCTRCDDCVRACAATHDNNPRFIRHGPKHDNLMIANACMHCVDPVCMIGCPTGAIARQPQTGIVEINDSTCIGCSTCADSCPYDAIRMVEIRDPGGAFYIDQKSQLPILRATKCDLCGGGPNTPACQSACPHNALIRMDMNDLPRLADWLDETSR